MILDAYQRHRIGTFRPLLQAIDKADNRGAVIAIVAARCGYSPDRMETLYYAWLRQGDEVLIDKRKLKRSDAGQAFELSDAERQLMRQLVMKCDSFQLAIEEFADRPECRPELREVINRHRARRNYPKWLREAARISDQERDLALGNKRFQLNAYTQLRDMTYIDSAGTEHPLEGGDLDECDDMSVNQPYWYEWPYGGDPLSDMFGVRIGRQILVCRDVGVGKYLGYSMIGRVRDAYRAEDVVRFLGQICETHGRPRLGFRLEKGVWAARSVRGVKGTTDEEERRVLGSIRDLVDIHYVHSPKSKGSLEGSFDFLQSIMALKGIQIGRHRDYAYEKTTALALACVAGRKHPADCGFMHISEIAEALSDAMAQADARPKMGRLVRGISQEMWEAAVTARPLENVPEDKRHLFMPVKKVLKIDGGHVRYKVPHYQHLFSFAVPGEWAHLGSRYKVLVCFDPSEPHLGAMVFDAEAAGRRDYDLSEGQSLGVWPFSRNAPQLDLSRSGNYSAKKEYLAASRTHFRATGMVAGTGASVDQMADGHGRSVKLERGQTLARPENLKCVRAADGTLQPKNKRAAEALEARRNHVAGEDRRTARGLSKVRSNALLDPQLGDSDDEETFAPVPQISSEALL